MINNITLYERRNKKETNISTAKQINKTFYTRVTHTHKHYFSQNFPLRQMSKQPTIKIPRFQVKKIGKNSSIGMKEMAIDHKRGTINSDTIAMAGLLNWLIPRGGGRGGIVYVAYESLVN